MPRIIIIIFLILEWLDDQLPAQCPVCGQWQQRKTMRFARHNKKGMIQICSDCYTLNSVLGMLATDAGNAGKGRR